MSKNEPTPLSPSASDALEALREPISQADGPPREAAIERVNTLESGVLRADAIVSELLSRGYLYEVNGGLHVIPAE